jgi:hypothetical protein
MTPEQQEVILSRDVPEGGRVIAHMVPTRAFRVIELAGAKTYRVEQLDAGTWKWRTISTHIGDEEFESFNVALKEGIDAQEKFKSKILKAKAEHNHARRIAEAEANRNGQSATDPNPRD